MHATKTLVYQRHALVGARELGYGLLLGIAMVAGSWTGRRVIDRLPRAAFQRLVEVLLVVSGLQLLLFG